jgi:uncharacterized protein GlcG (DUF336 family)
MMKRTHITLAGMAAILLSTTAALAAEDRLPGDGGRGANGGILPTTPQVIPATPAPRPKVARAPSAELALAAAKAIAEGCKQYPLGVAVVNSEGVPILVYIPDGSRASHTYTAIRKAYSAVTFKAPTSQFTAKAQQGDAEVLAKLQADPNLMSYSGGIPLKVGDEIIGAIGVSGAEPGRHDEECGLIGLEKIKGQLK